MAGERYQRSPAPAIPLRMPSEHRAVLLLLALALGGQGVRFLLSRPGDAPGAVRILGDRGSPAAHRDTILRHARPLAPGERVDLDVASLKEIERLPRVGPGLAKKIVADRAARGAFGSLNGLDRVPGIGAALLGALKPYVRFSAIDVTDGTDGSDGSDGLVGPELSGQGAGLVLTTPSVGPVRSVEPAGFPLNLNSASSVALQTLPGIGLTRARAIVAYREAHGPFASIEALGKVPGIGPSIVKRINGLAIAE